MKNNKFSKNEKRIRGKNGFKKKYIKRQKNDVKK